SRRRSPRPPACRTVRRTAPPPARRRPGRGKGGREWESWGEKLTAWREGAKARGREGLPFPSRPRAPAPSRLLPVRLADLLDRPLCLPVALRVAHDVGLGDDAHEGAALVHDGDAAYLLRAHHLHHVVHAVVLAAGAHAGTHHVAHRRAG